MTEIEKMCENVGVEKKRMCEWTCKGNEFCSTNCEHYESTKEFYPPLTAEKQIELIKWLMINIKDYQYDVEDNKFWFYIDDCRETKYREFDEALAELINLYWQDLTEQEKEEIRRILE